MWIHIKIKSPMVRRFLEIARRLMKLPGKISPLLVYFVLFSSFFPTKETRKNLFGHVQKKLKMDNFYSMPAVAQAAIWPWEREVR